MYNLCMVTANPNPRCRIYAGSECFPDVTSSLPLSVHLK